MYGATAYIVGNVNTGWATSGVPLAMAMQGLALPRIAGGVPIIKTPVPVSTALVPVDNTLPIMVRGGVDPSGIAGVPMYSQVQPLQQGRGKANVYVGPWKKVVTNDGGKFWVNNVTGAVSTDDPLK